MTNPPMPKNWHNIFINSTTLGWVTSGLLISGGTIVTVATVTGGMIFLIADLAYHRENLDQSYTANIYQAAREHFFSSRQEELQDAGREAGVNHESNDDCSSTLKSQNP